MTFPINVVVGWDPNPAADAVTSYTVFLNGTAVGSPTGTSETVSIPAAGTYTFGVSAVNIWGESDPDTISVAISPAGKPTGIKVTKA